MSEGFRWDEPDAAGPEAPRARDIPDRPAEVASRAEAVPWEDDRGQRIVATAVRAARVGGQVALARLGNPGYLKWKGFRDAEVGSVLEVQAAIIGEIRREFPDHPILAEESEARPAEDADPLWIVDPIDGSLNFLQGLPFFAISIGFRSQGVYRVGVVYDPCRDELFQGVLGQGARLNGEPIAVQQVGEGALAFANAIIGTDWPYSHQRRDQSVEIARVLAPSVLTLNVMGSPSLGLCYVAAGRLHAYYHLELEMWDVAGGAVILSEAGGLLTNSRGSSWLFAEKAYIASNGVVHLDLVQNIQGLLALQTPPATLSQGTLLEAGGPQSDEVSV